MNSHEISSSLMERFGEVTEVRPSVFRVTRTRLDRPYAVLYFDASGAALGDNVDLRTYQEDLLSDTYFEEDAPSDLRWNHYLYLIDDRDGGSSALLSNRIKAIEADRTYARKRVLSSDGFRSLVAPAGSGQNGVGQDVVEEWTRSLGEAGLSFVADEALPATKAAALIAAGRVETVKSVDQPAALSDEEQAATVETLTKLVVEGFGSYVTKRTFDFGRVNLISGVNGAGKTSLLEAIEYLFSRDNRRERPHRDGARVTGSFGTGGKMLTTAFSTSPLRLRARNFHWYSRSDVRKSTLLDGFSKFNFLDTDAAVRLSIDGSDGSDIGRDVSRLVLGPEAERLAARVERVATQVGDRFRQVRVELNEAHKKIAEAERRLLAYRSTPRLSDELFLALQSAMSDCYWREALPSTKQDCNHLVAPLASANASAEYLVSHLDSAYVDIDDLERLRRSASSNLEAAEGELRRYIGLERSLATINEQERSLQKRSNALNALDPYVEGEFRKLLLERSRLQSESSSHSRRAPILRAAVSAMQTLDAGANFGSELDRLQGQSEEVAELLRGARDRELQVRTLSETAQALSKQLFASAAGLLPHLDNPDECPLCSSVLAPGSLAAKLHAATNALGSAALEEAQTRRIELEQLFEAATNTLAALRNVVPLLTVESTDSVQSVADSALRILADAEVSNERLAQLNEWHTIEQGHGRSVDAYEDLCVAAAVDLDVSAVELLSLREQVRQEREDLHASRRSTAEEIDLARVRLIELGGSGGSYQQLADDLLPRIRERLSRAERALECARTLVTYCSVRDQSISVLSASLQVANGALSRLLSAMTEETSAVSQQSREEAGLRDLQQRRDNFKATVDRLEGAAEVLGRIVAQSNQGDYVHKVLGEMAKEIGAIFSSIHSPAEFSVEPVASGGLVIRRTRTREQVTTEQMSTGQRSAYALSLFLSMNASLRNGPRVVLLDDPIAHVDDLNALSFLDHLRSIAVDSGRQIFFATADEKIASLFRQKFRFLGPEDFRELALA